MKWRCIRLTREEYLSGELDVLRGAFHSVYVSRNGPRGMALLGAWSEDERHYLVYVSPAAERYFLPILTAYSAEVKESAPRASSLSFLCGDEEGTSILVC